MNVYNISNNFLKLYSICRDVRKYGYVRSNWFVIYTIFYRIVKTVFLP